MKNCLRGRGLFAILALALGAALTSCHRGWTEQDKATFVSGCVNGAVKDMDSTKAKQYCQCMLQKMEERYPDPSTLSYLKNDTALHRIGQGCLK